MSGGMPSSTLKGRNERAAARRCVLAGLCNSPCLILGASWCDEGWMCLVLVVKSVGWSLRSLSLGVACRAVGAQGRTGRVGKVSRQRHWPGGLPGQWGVVGQRAR